MPSLKNFCLESHSWVQASSSRPQGWDSSLLIFWAACPSLSPWFSKQDQGSQSQYLDIFGPIWTNLEPFGPIRTNVDQFGPIWTHLGPFGPPRSYLVHFWVIWSYLEQIGAIWRCFELFRDILSPWQQLAIWSNFKPFGNTGNCLETLGANWSPRYFQIQMCLLKINLQKNPWRKKIILSVDQMVG